MPIVVTLVLVVVFAVLASALLNRYAKARVGVSEVGYVVIGVLLGPFGLRLLDTDVMDTIRPFVSLTLGVVGFSLGLALRRRLLALPALGGGFVIALGVGGTVGAVLYFGLLYLPIDPSPLEPILWPVVTIGSAAATISTAAVESGVRLHRARGDATDMLRGFALTGSVFGVAISGTALALSRSAQASNRFTLTQTEWLVALILLGVSCGVLFALFMGKDREEGDDRLFLATVGIVIFASGMASAAGMSPLLLNAIVGVVVSLIAKDSGLLHVKLARLERPAVTTVLIFAGAMWSPVFGVWWLAPLVYVAVRLLTLRVAANIAVDLFDDLPRVHRAGSALWAQGGISAAIAVSYAQVYPAQSSIVLTTVLAALVVQDLSSGAALGRFLVDAGEHDRLPPESEGPTLPVEVS
ncbi:MAG: hypothetical protein RMA76_14320 [Deltaproteobacteria bacterium]